ncbi:111aa long hypothetical protein [Pyrococcus horikoshii OT3]|uniref:Uncharacterized protein n=1 Tax=Pyrococcus horikoshii (strain ATCC 700860 / DSM 12428 / JCM 9974 / NBRC 100139 / OT-3) TaxID=70601 RepID=O59081_PYRHO|nr:111aa long hypothetical protein [Pyrococcus horikoshii OT3]
MSDSTLGHYRNRHGIHYLLDLLNRGHSRNATGLPYVCRNLVKGHYCNCTSLFSYSSLFRVGYIHYNSAFYHLCETPLQPLSSLFHNYFQLVHIKPPPYDLYQVKSLYKVFP